MTELTEVCDEIGLPRATGADVVARACRVAFGEPLVVNYLRSLLVETMVAQALPNWKWVSGDWAGWDFEDTDGVRLEVKQSAAKQTWLRRTGAPTKCSFDIAARTGHWVGDNFTLGHRRYAHIYVFAHHPIFDNTADHRDPYQWLFYVVETSLLPSGQKTIALPRVQRIATVMGYDGLAERVELVRDEVAAAKIDLQ